jgi:FkbM family methyltransferase
MQALRLKSGLVLRRVLINGGEMTQGGSAFSSLLRKVKTNLNDMGFFGPTVVRRHLKRHSADPRMTVAVPQVGTVHVRAGESDIATLRQVFIGGEYDLSHPPALAQRVQGRYRAIVDAGSVPIIADIGANIGAASLWFKKIFPEAAVVAVEPDPDNAVVLRRNLVGRPRVSVVEAAIGATAGFVALENRSSGWAVQTKRAESGIAIVTIPDVLGQVQRGVPFIIKIDIEGFESDLFKSNLDWIAQAYVVMIEPHDWMLPGQMTSRTFQQAMAAHPFEMFIRGENILYVRV